MKVDVACAVCQKVTSKRSDHLVMIARPTCSVACANESRRVDGAKWRDRAKIAAYMRDYTERNRAVHNARTRKWAKANRDVRNRLQRARRGSTAASDSMSSDEWIGLKRRYGFRCLACNRAESLLVVLEPDHVLPVAIGGGSELANMQPLCRSCNASKGAKHIDYRIVIDVVRA